MFTKRSGVPPVECQYQACNSVRRRLGVQTLSRMLFVVAKPFLFMEMLHVMLEIITATSFNLLKYAMVIDEKRAT